MAILSGPQNAGIPGYKQIKPKVPQNPWHIPNALGNDVVTGIGAPHAPAAPVAPAAAPPPIDFNALTLSDPQYTVGRQQLEQQNQLTLEQLLKGYRGQAQGAQDSANSHGALFSGAAVNAQRSLGQNYADQQRQQALNYGQQSSGLYNNVFQRLIQQLAGGQ